MSRLVFIITGTRKGIGKSLAEFFLGQGHIVAGCSRKEVSIDHPEYTHYMLDVSDEKSVVVMVRDVFRRYGRLDVLLNNAGIAAMNHLLTMPYKTAQSIFATNFFGPFLFTRECSKLMMKQNYGRIVNFSTVAVPLRLEGEAIYAASKSAIETFTKISAWELAKFNITVNAVGPTPMQTDLIKNISQDKLDALLDRQAIKRFGSFIDVQNVVKFFISADSNFITGQVVYLGGVQN